MGSRIRENPERLYELFVEVARPDEHTEPFILQSFPEDYSDQDVIKSIPKFAFPCTTDGTMVDHFTFVLTDVESMYRFGFCRHATGAQTCLCFISFLPWYEVFYNLLNYIAELLNSTGCTIDTILQAVYIEPVPQPDIPVTIVAGQQMFSFNGPDKSKLSSISTSRNLTEYYNAIDTDNMMKIFACMLNERRILVVSRKLSRITACVHAAASLLYPMYWQHLYIPVMPQHLLDYCSAPMPYIIGVHSSLFSKLRRPDLGDAVIVFADTNVIESEFDDLAEIPPDVITTLRKSLRFQQNDAKKSSAFVTSSALPLAFMRSLVTLIGGYRDALRFRHGEPITFDPVAFVQTRPVAMQPFLEKVLQLQIFQQFIHDRLDMLNCGQGFNDLFEAEASLLGDKLNAQSRYKDWSTNMKKQGKRFQKGGKVVWSRLQKRARPVMTTAVKSVKSQGHKAYKGLRSRIGNLNKDDDTDSSPGNTHELTVIVDRPIVPARTRNRTPPSRQAYSMVGHATLPRSSSSGDRPIASTAKPSQDRVSRQYKLLAVEEKSMDDAEANLDYNRMSMNLINDPDIQRAMKKSISLTDIPAQVQESSESEYCSASSDERLDKDATLSHFQYDQLIEDNNRTVPAATPATAELTSVQSQTISDGASNLFRSQTTFYASLEQNTTVRHPPPRPPKPPDFSATRQQVDTQKQHSSPPVCLPGTPPNFPVPAPRMNKSKKDNHSKVLDKSSDKLTDTPSLIKLDSVDSDSDLSFFDPLAETKPRPKCPPTASRVNSLQPKHTPNLNENELIADLFDPLSSVNVNENRTTGTALDSPPMLYSQAIPSGPTVNIAGARSMTLPRQSNNQTRFNEMVGDAHFSNVSISSIQNKLLNHQYSQDANDRPTYASIQHRNTQKLIESYNTPRQFSPTVSSSAAAINNPIYGMPPYLAARFGPPPVPIPASSSSNNPFLIQTRPESTSSRVGATFGESTSRVSNKDPFDNLLVVNTPRATDDSNSKKWETFE